MLLNQIIIRGLFIMLMPQKVIFQKFIVNLGLLQTVNVIDFEIFILLGLLRFDIF